MADRLNTRWQRSKEALAAQVTNEVASRLESGQRELEARLGAIEAELAAATTALRELQQLGAVQVEVASQASDIFGRLLRSLTTRVEELEQSAPSS